MFHNQAADRDLTRARLKDFLADCSSAELLDEFQAAWLNRIVPGLDRLKGCDQGRLTHLEGDVAVHTALVFKNLSAVAAARLDRKPDFIERLAVLVHDLKKPATRNAAQDGAVSFPGHEASAAQEICVIAERIALSPQETERLHFIVARHGDAHGWRDLSEQQRIELTSSPWIISLALMQEADARSCIMPGGAHLPIYWNELTS